MSAPSLIGETVEWEFDSVPSLGTGLSRKGSGFAHSVAHESGEGTMWTGFVVLVELGSGELVSIPAVDANMRVIRRDPTA